MARRSLRIQEKKRHQDVSQAQDATVDGVSDSTAGLKRVRDGEASDSQEFGEDEDHGDYEDTPRKGKKRLKKAKGNSVLSGVNEQNPKSTTKRQRMPEQFRKVRGRLGLLERLAKDVPLDVILEIFSYLEPGDLLHLARTSRDLRNILMSKTSETFWRISRNNVEGLPSRPDDLNEPQYAHLLFEPYCHICGRSGRCEIIFWNFRMRACKKCALATFPSIWSSEYVDRVPSEFQHMEILPSETFKLNPRRRSSIGNYEIVARYQEEYEALRMFGDRNAWINRKRKERLVINEHSRLCEKWHRARLSDRAEELSDIRKERKEAILNRLQEVNWRDEAEIIMNGPSYLDGFSDHKAVKQSKKLTDYGWNCIKDELTRFLSDQKAQRIAKERNKLIFSRFTCIQDEFNKIRSESDLREPFPSLGDILAHKVFEDLIWDTPENENLTAEHCRSKLLELMPHIIEEWRPAKIRELVEIMRKSRPTATADDLHLATTIFECTRCYYNSHLHYPQMFYHNCCTDNRVSANPNLNNDRVLPFFHESQWTSTSIVFSDSSSELAKTIVEACLHDPTTTTFEDMCTDDSLVECQECRRASGWEINRYFMRWPLPVVHQKDHTLSVNSVAEEEREAIIRFEPSTRSEVGICCAYCHKAQQGHFYILVLHLTAEHSDIIDVQELQRCEKLQMIKQHWYWSPRIPVERMGQYFYHKTVLDGT